MGGNAFQCDLEALAHRPRLHRDAVHLFEVSRPFPYCIVVRLLLRADYHAGRGCDHIVRFPSFEAPKLQPRSRLLFELLRDVENEDALFSVHDREITVRCEAERRHLFIFQIVLHALPVGLFIKTEDEAHSFLRYEVKLRESLHREQRRYSRAFVIVRSASVQLAVSDLAGERIVRPALAFRYAVEMGGYAHYVTVFLISAAELDMSSVIVDVHGFEAELLALRKHVFEGFVYTFPKRNVTVIPDGNAFDRYEFSERSYFFAPVFLYLSFYLFQVCHTNSFPPPEHARDGLTP